MRYEKTWNQREERPARADVARWTAEADRRNRIAIARDDVERDEDFAAYDRAVKDVVRERHVSRDAAERILERDGHFAPQGGYGIRRVCWVDIEREELDEKAAIARERAEEEAYIRQRKEDDERIQRHIADIEREERGY